ncbi:RHS repeat-associated protein [Actinomycetospora corticicola]|uniref:RHS repeat-associated protein n=2 Tax=Actinomycetospora corticicola TaxID=663602 RepID=A0A7Y9E1L3_9PSEU|nr:RHS repeat-associated protein [Actinomycetospora corticicola]
MPMPGDAGAVEAGATQLSSTAEQFTSAGEGIRAAGGGLGSAWTGGAATAATGQIAEIGSRAAIGADVSRLAGQALTTYANELRAAQEMFARGEEMVRQGEAELAAASARVAGLAGTAAPASQQQDAAMDAANLAVTVAQQKIDEGRALMERATQQELQANQAATSQVQAAQGQLAGMTAPVTGAAGGAPGAVAGAPGAPLGPPIHLAAAAPPAPPKAPEEESGFSWKDLGHAALDLAGLVPVVGEVADGANAAWYTAEGDYLNAGLSAAAMIPFAGWAAAGVKGGIKVADAVEAGSRLAPEAAAAIRTAPSPPSGMRIDMAPATRTPPAEGLVLREPVDMGTGHLLLPAVDVVLPGALPLVLERFHRSTYRSGRFFGPTWTSTLDQHVVVTADEIVLARADGMALHFPTTGGASREDPRWTLALDGTTPVVGNGDRRWHFGGAGEQRWLTAVVERGHRVDVDRLADGTPLEVVHGGGYRVRVLSERDRKVGYDLVGAGPDGEDRALVRFGYEAGNLTAVVASSGLPTRFGYDERGRITGWADRIGTWFRHEYDDHDRLVRQVGSGDTLNCTFAYSDDVVSCTDSLGHTTRYVHDEDGRVVRTIDPLGHERRSAYEGGRLVTETDELGRTTRFGHDALGVLDRVVRPDGSEVVEEHDDAGRPVRVRDADGAVWSHAYDGSGRRVATTDPLGATSRYEYDDGGLIAVVDALGGTTRVENDAAGLPVAVTDPVGAVTRWERDAFGRVVAETDPTGLLTRFSWTLEGRLATRTLPDGGVERRLYDGEGNLTSVTSATGAVTRFEHTHFDLVAARIEPDGSRFEQAWDTEMRLVGVTSPDGSRWTYEYDAAGRLVAETDYDGRRRTYDVDAAGQVRARTNALGETVTYGFTALGQVAERRARGSLTTYDHDPVGRLVRATTPDVDVVLTRDAVGRVVGEATNGRAVTSSYDPLGRRTERTTPAGQVSRWTYAPDSTVRSLVAGVEIGFDHDVAGRETRRRAGGGVVEQEWSAGRMVGQRIGDLSREYRYGADGALTGVGAREFDLDARGRVTAIRAGAWVEQYDYDALGNTTDASWPGADPDVSGPRSFRGTVLERAGRVSYAHDAEGRVVQRVRRRLGGRAETWRYEWDALDQLVGVTTPDGARWRYVYDAFGRRVSKVRDDGSEQVDFAWDGPTLVEEVRHTADGVSATTWDHVGLHPVAQRTRSRAAGQAEIDEAFFSIVTDLVGAPTELVSDDGSVVGQARRSLWGRTTWSGVSTPLLFPGQYLDPETGFAYNLHRYYDPDTARYLSQDPLGLAPAPNPAAYVHNPHTWADPLGLNPCAAQPPASGGGQPALPPGPSARQKALPPSSGLVDLASPNRRQHILFGDGPGRGGHYPPAQSGKTEFPARWGPEQTMHHVSDIATDPNAVVKGGGKGGGLFDKHGAPARFRHYGVRDGVSIKVVTEPAGEGIITAHPHSGAWN